MATPQKRGDSWRIRYTDEYGQRRGETYQDYETAELMLEKRTLRVKEVKAGWKTGRVVDRTFSELCDEWLKSYAPLKRSRRHIESIIETHLRPHFGDYLLSKITSQHVKKFVAERGHLASKTVHNLLILLKSMLREAKEIGWLSTVPRIKVPKFNLNESSYRYLKTRKEIDRFLTAAKEDGDSYHILYKFAIYTGLRAGEIAGLRRADIDMEANIITVQRSYDGPTKNNCIRRVPIFDILKPDLAAWLLKGAGEEIVFPNQAGRMHAESSRVFQEILHRVLKEAEFPEEKRKRTIVRRTGKNKGKKERRVQIVRYIRFHDLRHTFASHFMMAGGDLFKLQRILGHKSLEMTQRYAHLAPDAFSGDLGMFGDASETTGIVVPLNGLSAQ